MVGHDEIEGQVTSGQFCQTGTNYTLHFVAQFEHPFAASGTFGQCGQPARYESSASALPCGAYVTLRPRRPQRTRPHEGGHLLRQYGRRGPEPRGRGPRLVRGPRSPPPRTTSGTRILDRIAVGGGTPAQQHIFYTALYHSLLFPNVVSDVNGDYAGSDGQVHTDHGRQEYANFSEWDIYRSEIQLESLLDPHAVGDMVQSLVDDAEQGGWLPKWAIVGGDESQMNGDSADPIIADAYAMGVRNFDVQAALDYMVKGATQDGVEPRARDRAPVPEPVPLTALRQRGLARSDLHRLLHRRVGHARVRHRRLRHLPHG